MSMRRPRIKAAAILPPKRPAREGSSAATTSKQAKIEPKVEPKVISSPVKEKVAPNKSLPVADNTAPTDNTATDQRATTAKPATPDVTSKPEQVTGRATDKLFKYPPIVANHKRSESFSTSDIESDRADDTSSQHDALRNLQGPLSPVKFRQRIRPTPFFGMRRNSTQGYGSDMEEEPRRQRHTSTSSNSGTSIPARMRPPTGQRTRTESSCSNFSDYSRDQNVKPTRKSAPSEEYLRALTAKKEYLSRFNGKIPEKCHMKMSDLIYYNPTTNPMTTTDQQKSTLENNNAQEAIAAKPATPLPLDETVTPEKETCMPVPQLKLGPNGEMILDEQSLVIETTAEKEARATLANSNVIYMDEFSGNNGFYRRTKRTRDWPAEETIKFYRCLHTVGTDFSLMLTLFPNRSRRDLKLKFKKEERLNLNLINKALLYPKAFNIADLKQELEKEQQEYDAKKKEWEEIKKKTNVQKKKKPKPKQGFSKSSRILNTGDFIYETEVITPSPTEQERPPVEVLNIETVKSKAKQNIQEKIARANESENEPIIETVSPEISTKSVHSLHPIKMNNETIDSSGSCIQTYTYSSNDTVPYQETDASNGVQILFDTTSEQITPSKHNECSVIKNSDLLVDEVPPTPDKNTNVVEEQVESDQNANKILSHEPKIEKCDILKRAKDEISDCNLAFSELDPIDENLSVPNDDIDTEMERFMLHDLGNILTNLIMGSLVVVASEDENDSSKVINEIYVMCKETGTLSDKPLDLPEDVVNCIIEELNAN